MVEANSVFFLVALTFKVMTCASNAVSSVTEGSTSNEKLGEIQSVLLRKNRAGFESSQKVYPLHK